MPFYHCFGMVMGNLGCTTHGATMVIPAAGFRSRPRRWRPIEQERCTGVYGVPTMFIAMLGHPDFAERDLSSLRTGIMAGAVCPVEVMKRCVNDMNMTEVAIAYGMTETSPVSCQTLIDDDEDRRTSSIGRAHPHVEVKIVDPDTGDVVERGQPGEFCTRGYSVMLGYWQDDEKTAEAIDSEGWMHTGDLAVMREDGYCNVVGRIKDMVIRGGENVYPREVEEFLYTHPDIEDAQVIGVPDARYGEEICAWIRMKPGRAALDVDAVRAFADGQAGALQDSPLRARRRRVPDDGDRQDPQGRHARRERPAARPLELRRAAPRLNDSSGIEGALLRELSHVHRAHVRRPGAADVRAGGGGLGHRCTG